MTRNEQLEAIRAAVIKANPDIIINKHAQLIKFDHTVEYFEQSRPIRLADVLLAVQVRKDNHCAFLVSDYGDFLFEERDTERICGCGHLLRHHIDGCKIATCPCENYRKRGTRDVIWNLRKDDLTEQSEVCISF